MKKMLSIFLVLSFGFNLTANDNLIKSKREAIPSIALPSQIENNSRTEEWILYPALRKSTGCQRDHTENHRLRRGTGFKFRVPVP